MERGVFIAAGQAAYGKHFVSPLALELGVTDRTVRNWVAGKYKLPPEIEVKVKEILLRRQQEISEFLVIFAEPSGNAAAKRKNATSPS